ncbi:hypothetical protein PHLCEN_2v7745 [Hermanssonia centrifuga]|uniref:Uncharacterized protein n=1 Tax=Hermanssonia centrifuga TaxID=98765 RepID=A0A2R6NVK0_9APHY|nr:hypothetical protein PHLCEN_2v7745 [Hermanssonia centrifuga]
MSRTHPSVLGQTSPVLGGIDEADFANRGRPLSRELPVVEEPEDEWTGGSTAQRRSSRASRKGAGMVFLGAWALFSVGTLAGSKRGLATGSAVRMGRVLTMDEVAFVRPPPTTQDNILHFTAIPDVRGSDATLFFNDLRFADDIPPSGPDEQGPSTDYVIGRISAWICTTLYLTSRLPQIWKNYVRKSVEGLSISLFVFAFLGNFLYVTSILTSPNLSLPEPQASAFLRESIPYILGSGGTLMFDITIVTQSFLYRPKAHLRGRRASRTFDEEEEGLLGAGATGSDDPVTPSRRRNLTQSEVRD